MGGNQRISFNTDNWSAIEPKAMFFFSLGGGLNFSVVYLALFQDFDHFWSCNMHAIIKDYNTLVVSVSGSVPVFGLTNFLI